MGGWVHVCVGCGLSEGLSHDLRKVNAYLPITASPLAMQPNTYP